MEPDSEFIDTSGGIGELPVPMRPIARMGRALRRLSEEVGAATRLFGSLIRAFGQHSGWAGQIGSQAYAMGVSSLPLVIFTALLAGSVTSSQSSYQFTGTLPLSIVGSVVTESVILELGPVLTAMLLIGQVGARIAAELGTMKVSDQIDAIEALGRDPVTWLVFPRVIGGLIVIPALVILADVVGVGAGMLVSWGTIGLYPGDFLAGARLYFHGFDLWFSLAKAVCFAFAITFVPCFVGLRTKGGAEGVGRATTLAVVSMILIVLLLDAFLAATLLK